MIVNRRQSAVVRGGFTLMEILVVAGILVVLAGAAIPVYLNYLDSAKRDRAKLDVITLQKEAMNYKAKTGDYPDSLDQLTIAAEDWKPTITQDALIDPWKNRYNYSKTSTHTQLDIPEVWSDGAHQGDQTGQIGSWMKK